MGRSPMPRKGERIRRVTQGTLLLVLLESSLAVRLAGVVLNMRTKTFMVFIASWAAATVLISRNSTVCGKRSWLTISSLPFDVRMEVRGAMLIDNVKFGEVIKIR
jgi:hypothetical protein